MTHQFERLIVNNKKTGKEYKLEVSGVFIAVGQIPQNEIFAETVKLDGNGFILASEDCMTSHPGIFAAGRLPHKRSKTAHYSSGRRSSGGTGRVQIYSRVNSDSRPPVFTAFRLVGMTAGIDNAENGRR